MKRIIIEVEDDGSFSMKVEPGIRPIVVYSTLSLLAMDAAGKIMHHGTELAVPPSGIEPARLFPRTV